MIKLQMTPREPGDLASSWDKSFCMGVGCHPFLKGSLHGINKRVVAPQSFHPVLDAGPSVCSFLQADDEYLGVEGRS